MKLKKKVIIVTGASKGLGVAMARTCAAEGARVVCAARDLGSLESLAANIRQSGGDAFAVRCDMAIMGDLRTLVEQTVGRYGTIDGLINNAGVNFVKPFVSVTEEEWNHVLDVDLKGSFFLTQLCARQMLKQKRGGSVVQIASVHTQASLAGASPYDAAKHGMVGFSKAAAVELAPHGIRVNILSPGLCRTVIWKDIVAAAPSEKACLDYWNANIPARKLIEPEEVARCCVFLLSDDSSCITGANIMADHGMTSLLVSREPYASKEITGS
ncbi:MAG: SDR family oxidoreductase [Candidatus Paceibacterota bacterium]|jgi:NAD(P)-dependent dehydrogenase (short-subunit alcohol dehydrogenase family)